MTPEELAQEKKLDEYYDKLIAEDNEIMAQKDKEWEEEER